MSGLLAGEQNNNNNKLMKDKYREKARENKGHTDASKVMMAAAAKAKIGEGKGCMKQRLGPWTEHCED